MGEGEGFVKSAERAVFRKFISEMLFSEMNFRKKTIFSKKRRFRRCISENTFFLQFGSSFPKSGVVWVFHQRLTRRLGGWQRNFLQKIVLEMSPTRHFCGIY